MIKTILLALTLWLAGCASDGDGPGPVTPPGPPTVVYQAVPVPCVVELPKAPRVHLDAELRALDDYGFVTALHADRLALEIYTAKLEAILAACK